MQEENPEIAFPTIKFPIMTDLQMNAIELAKHYDLPHPENIYEITSIVLTNIIVRLFYNENVKHNPSLDDNENLDIKGACLLYVIGTAMCRVLVEQGNEIDLMELYKRSGSAIFQGCSDDYISRILQEGEYLGERLFEEALANGEINEFVLFVMSLGLLYSIEPKGSTMNSIVSLFEQIKDI